MLGQGLKETEEYNKMIGLFSLAKSEEELNTMLLNTYEELGINKPWQGDFNEHMSNKNGTLIFE